MSKQLQLMINLIVDRSGGSALSFAPDTTEALVALVKEHDEGGLLGLDVTVSGPTGTAHYWTHLSAWQLAETISGILEDAGDRAEGVKVSVVLHPA